MSFELRGERVLLRALASGDVPTLVAYRNDPSVVRFQSWSSYSEDEALALVSLMASSSPGVDGSWYQWGIFCKGALVGDVGLRTFDDARQGEIGFTLSPFGTRAWSRFRRVSARARSCVRGVAVSPRDRGDRSFECRRGIVAHAARISARRARKGERVRARRLGG